MSDVARNALLKNDQATVLYTSHIILQLLQHTLCGTLGPALGAVGPIGNIFEGPQVHSQGF